MNKAMHNSETARPNKFNYAQAARPSYPRTAVHPQQQQRVEGTNDLQTDFKNSSVYAPSANQGHGSFKKTYSSSYKSKENNSYNNFKKASVQLPMAPPTETSHIQFGSINQNPNIPVTSTNGSNKTGDIPVLREVKFGSLPVTDATLYNKHRPQIRSQQQQPKTEIPRSARATNDARLFTQAYAPRREFNQGDFSNNNNGNNRYYNNRHNGNHKNNYVKPPNATQQNNHYHNNNNNAPIVSYQQYSAPPQHIQSQLPPQQPTQQSPLIQPTTSNSSSYHRSPPKIQHSPQLQQQSPQQTSPSMHTSPNTNYTKKNISPSMSNSSPQNIPVAANAWPPQFVSYYPQYSVPVAPYNSMPPHNRGYVPPTNVKKPITIVNPNTGAALDTTQMALSTIPATTKPEKFEFKIPQPNVSKRVLIVDPATRDKELREKREREEAELEAKRKAEEERLEQERKAAEEKERLEREEKEREEKEREEKERLEREEKERLEREEKERKEKEEAERMEKERLILLEAEIQKKRTEEEARRKAEEEQELKRIKSELEAKKKKDEEERIRSLPRSIQLIEDPSTIEYPSVVEQPPSKVNGRFTYSVEFLKLFGTLCQDATSDLSRWKETFDNAIEQKQNGGNVIRERSSSHRGQNGQGSTFRVGSRDGRMEMGKFNTGRPLNPRNNNSNGMFMERQGSSSGRGGSMGGRGGRGGMKIIRNPSQQQSPSIPATEPVAPLEKTENRWVPATLSQTKPVETTESGLLSEELIIRKVKSLLNKLTIEKFDPISAQIFEYARQSEKEEDGKALRTVMKLTFEKACDEPAFASMWASLCRRMYDSMTNDIRDTSLLDDNGNPSFGVLLFRRYLFNRCQEEFEKGWKVDMPEAEEGEMMTEEYYIAAKAKRQGLGLIQLIGELFKLEMLSERIMYGCLIKLCNDPTNAGDEEAESLCKLLITIGKKLDSKPQTSRWVDIVTKRMKDEMVKSAKMSSRMKFMIQDVLDLRKQSWVPRNASNQFGPTTLAKIHEMAEKDKEQKEAATLKRGSSNRGPYIPNQYNNVQRAGSYRNGRDHFQSHNSNNTANNHSNGSVDGWNTIGNSSPVNEKPRMNELSNFGKTDRSRAKNNILGPSNSPFPSLARNKAAADSKNSGDGRSSPAVNMFSALCDGDEPEEPKKLQLSPKANSSSEVAIPNEKTSDEALKRKLKNIINEYFSIRDKKELAECIKELDGPHDRELFALETLTVVERKAKDVDEMCNMVAYLLSENLIEKQTFVKAFTKFMEGYEDLKIDVPQASKHVEKLLEATSIKPSDEGAEEIYKYLS